MQSERQSKGQIADLGIMDGKNKVGRPHREWVDDIEERCRANMQQLSRCLQNRTKWNKR